MCPKSTRARTVCPLGSLVLTHKCASRSLQDPSANVLAHSPNPVRAPSRVLFAVACEKIPAAHDRRSTLRNRLRIGFIKDLLRSVSEGILLGDGTNM